MKKLFLVLSVFSLTGCDRAPVVEVGGESLTGMYVEDGTVAAFLGVPFAEPPVGDLRWRAPQPLTNTVAKRDATQFAPACIQSMRILDWYRWLAVSLGGTADYYEDLEIITGSRASFLSVGVQMFKYRQSSLISRSS